MSNNTERARVTANLAATYDLAAPGTRSVEKVDYLCVYDYEYGGVKYKFRTHQRETFDPIPERITLELSEDPAKAFRARESSGETSSGSSSLMPLWIFLGIGLAMIVYLIHFVVTDLLQSDLELSTPVLLLLIGVIVFSVLSARKANRKREQLDARIEDAILNGRTAVAHRVKYRYYNLDLSDPNDQRRKGNPYEGIYKCEYNGKTYRVKYRFSNTPPQTIKLFFEKTPKKALYYNFSSN